MTTVIFVPHLNPRSNKGGRYDNLNTRYDIDVIENRIFLNIIVLFFKKSLCLEMC